VYTWIRMWFLPSALSIQLVQVSIKDSICTDACHHLVKLQGAKPELEPPTSPSLCLRRQAL
jgi:hypothetical protein